MRLTGLAAGLLLLSSLLSTGCCCVSRSGCGDLYIGPWISDPPACDDPCTGCGLTTGCGCDVSCDTGCDSCGPRPLSILGLPTLFGYVYQGDCSSGGACDAAGCGFEALGNGCDCGLPVCGCEPACGLDAGCGFDAVCGVEPGCGYGAACPCGPSCGCGPGSDCGCGGGMHSDVILSPGAVVPPAPPADEMEELPSQTESDEKVPTRTRRIYNPKRQ